MRRVAHRSITMAALAVLALGCPSLGRYTCEEAPDCDLVMGGACESDGRCSYPDGECDSGRRYAGTDDVSGPCVPADGHASTSSSETSASTSSGHDSNGTTSSPPQCGNGVVEPGEACDELDDVEGDTCNVDCVESGTPLWGEGWDHEGGDDKGYGMAIAPDGRFAIVGFVTDTAGEQDAFVQMREESGAIAWTVVLPNTGIDAAEQVLFDGDGGVIACGVMADPTSLLDQGWIRRFDANGDETWSVVLAEPEGSWIKDCEPRDDGTFTIAGVSGAPLLGRGLVGLYAADGTPVWQQLHGEPALDRTDLTAATVGADDLIVVGGQHDFGDDAWLSIVAAYTPAGDLAWEADPGGTNMLVQECFAVGRGIDGAYAMGRVFGNAGDIDAWIGAYEGPVLGPWNIESTPTTGSEEFHRLAAHADGDLVIVGSKGGAGHDIWVLRYDAAYEIRWSREHGGDGRDDDKAWDVGFAPDGTILVAGYETTADRGIDVWLQRYAP